MKIFNRGTETKAQTAAPAAPAKAPPAPAGPAAAAAAMPAPAPAPEPAAPPAPDLAIILDANVKEMSEKIARLASNIESTQQDRSGFEAKLEQMEERMRKLSSLTEMISAQYNPFVGDAPAEREPLPGPEVGLAPPVVNAAVLPPTPAMAEPSAPLLALSLDPPAHEAPPAASLAPAAPEEPGVYLWSVPNGFESSMLLLGWSDMLLKSAGSRESLLELVNYYHNIGWIGDPARDQLLAYADGLTPPAAPEVQDWRASVEVHEKSLLFVEKLRAVRRRNE